MNRISRPVRKGFTRPLFLYALRRFPSFEQASRYAAIRLNSRPAHRLAIQQTTSGEWMVCRIIRGGVA